MLNKIMEDAAKSFWRELGKQALRQLVGALMSEGVKAGVDLYKQDRLARQKRRLSKEFKAEDAEEEQAQQAPDAPEPDAPGEDKVSKKTPQGPVVFSFD